jgi:hypothetical protein
MDWGDPGFVMAIIALSTIGWLVNNWIRARHGYAVEDEWGGKTERSDVANKALREENARLTQRLETFEDRMIVLERIVTDKGYSVAHQIEALRDDHKVEALLDKREKAK